MENIQTRNVFTEGRLAFLTLEQVLNLAENEYHPKNKDDFRTIEISLEVEPNLPSVNCTETEIEQVILNLPGNVAWVMTNAETQTPYIAIRASIVREFVKIEIEDNGPGMEERIKKRIFEPFYTTKPPGEGTRLGLSVSYMIIMNSHNGFMEVQSEQGKGTKFIIRLPHQ